MTEDLKQNDTPEEQSGPSEREILTMKADQLGIKYSPNIGIETLRARINEKLEGQEPETEEEVGEETPAQRRLRNVREATKLVRVRITNMNPVKNQLKGEYITAFNSYIPSITKFIPFGEGTQNGYHVPQIILNVMRERKFTRVVPDDKSPTLFRRERMNEFAIEVLPPLSPEELAELAADQRATGRVVDK